MFRDELEAALEARPLPFLAAAVAEHRIPGDLDGTGRGVEAGWYVGRLSPVAQAGGAASLPPQATGREGAGRGVPA